MTCTCCETGRCCNGSVCRDTSQSECVYRFGTFTTGGDCTQYACTSAPPYNTPCTLSNACVCSSVGKVLNAPQTTCNCTTLTAAGVPHGGCQAYYCNACVSGSCVLTCVAPRSCCAGTCCPLSQRCDNASGNCVDKCTTGTFCAGTGAAYDCCAVGEKCCGPSGCLATTTTTYSRSVVIGDPAGWNQVVITIPDGVTVTITATQNTAAQSPDGVPGTSADACNVIAVNRARLIGRVGDVVFDIGSNYTGTPGAGDLALRPNLTSGSCTNNQVGSYAVQISFTTDPCPGFTPAAIGEPIVYASGEEPPASTGPGTELKALLRLAGIVASPTCSCNARAAQMDDWGGRVCLTRLPEICGWLKEEAEKRGLWFFPPAGYALILAAISLSALKQTLRGNNK